ncbi:TlpA disulfide reductase family protein [Paludisphaera soli]|uniref:TlpA disulfide reductase family protein n=1 Tax=Paludisphaera soli TaxID=2712865 RepID=UPI0013EB0E22|nr:TlpA disulfide reductase family protein [Paludisphaera soli]
MRSIRRDKDLAAALKGRPFAVVGVNGDAEEDRAKVKEAVAKEGIAWRSFWAGGPDGEIPRTWGVQNLPTAYLLDAAGIIGDDQAGEDLTPAALEPLLRAAEDAAR